MEAPADPPAVPRAIPLSEAVRVWARIAALSFGGPAGQIALMHRVLVEEKRWIDEHRFLHALNFCMLLPGPEAQQLATYIGWLMHKVRGGLIAGTLFILPGMIAIMALSWIYVLFGETGAVEGVLFGLKAAVIALVFDAVRRIAGRALKSRALRAIAVAAFLALFLFAAPFPLVLLGAAVVGLVARRLGASGFVVGGHAPIGSGSGASVLGEEVPEHARTGSARTLGISAILMVLWLGPVALLAAMLGPDDVFTRIAIFFSQLAVVTFGGAYAVLAYVAQQAVEGFGWLAPGEMLDGLAMAETTPGPLIMVTQFVAFMAAYRAETGLPPMLAASLGGLLATWVTFVPCFVWIFAGAPYAERLRGNRAVAAALSAITAAVVGVIANLGVWFALHTLFGRSVEWRGIDLPVIASVDWAAAALTVGALVAVLKFRVGPAWLLGGCALLGLGWRLLG